VSSPIWGSWPNVYFSFTVTVLFLWGALSDERTGLSFIYAAGPLQRSLSRVRVPWNWWPHFTVSGLRLPFPSPPTTRRVTMEVFDPASTRVVSPQSCQSQSFLRLADYRQLVRLDAKPLETHGQNFFFTIEHRRSQSLCNILSYERMGLSFTTAAGPRQSIHS
jgi:hypothetical protein